MWVSNRSRKVHDPWGNKRHNKCGSLIRYQYYVGYGDLGPSDSPAAVNKTNYLFDRVGSAENNKDRFVRSPHSVEKLRR